MGIRTDRVGKEILYVLGGLLARGEVADPGVRGVTLQSVQVSPDLREARIYFSVYGEGTDKTRCAQALKRAAPFFRRELARHLQLRRLPGLHFQFDPSTEYAAHINSVLARVQEDAGV